ncbi:MAG: TlpA family protein disulfide reductase [Candidatus Pacebacteria bacterium]|nr:TlpA family protein disulfide reductase [Candidatus Paceibacterota bacterium]
MRRRIFTGLAVCAVVALVAFVFFFIKNKSHDDLLEGERLAPNFNFPDASGSPIILDEIHARVRVINFWASWSPYSKDELPALVALKHEFGDDIAIVALSRDTNPTNGRAFLASLGLGPELLFAYDRGDTYFKQVGGFNMPETIFVGERGEVLAQVHGPMSLDEMRAQVKRILDGN